MTHDDWEDVTAYSRDDKEGKPHAFALRLGGLRVSVTSGHIHYPGKWVMHCEPFYNTHLLAAKTEAEAKCQAFAKAQVKIEEAMKAVTEYISATN